MKRNLRKSPMLEALHANKDPFEFGAGANKYAAGKSDPFGPKK